VFGIVSENFEIVKTNGANVILLMLS